MTEAGILKIHRDRFYGSLEKRDFATLEQLYSDTYMLVRSDGSVLNKKQVLTDLCDHGLTFPSIELNQQQVRLFGSVAILSGESRTVACRNQIETRAHFRMVAVYALEGKAIRLVHFQSTTICD